MKAQKWEELSKTQRVAYVTGAALFAVLLVSKLFSGGSGDASDQAREPASSAATTAINSRTPCTEAASAFDARDAEAARAIDHFIESVMRQADQEHIRRHEGGIIARMSDDGFSTIRATTISYCRQHTDDTVQQAAVAMYDGVRGAQVSMGLR